MAVEELRLAPGGTLLDLACGRGDYGIEIAARADVRLIGVDFSAVAVKQARQRAARLATSAEFRVGLLDATGLEDGSVDAVLCIDSIQFAIDPPAAYAEMRRVLAPGRWPDRDQHAPDLRKAGPTQEQPARPTVTCRAVLHARSCRRPV